MNIVFLDFDGVINTCMWYWKEDGTLGTRYNFPNHGCVNNWQAVQWVSEFCQKYDFKIVISSTWRRGSTLSKLKEILKNSGLRDGIEVIGKTPILDGTNFKRGDEISLYLEQHPEVTEYIIFDDEADMTVHVDRLIQTDGSAGFGIKEFGMASKLIDLSEEVGEVERIDKILEYVITQEDRYYDFAGKAFDKENIQANLIHTAEATAFQRVRYFIEELMTEKTQ